MNDDLDNLNTNDDDTGASGDLEGMDSLDDLEAQLSSLGIFSDGDDDSDPFASFNFDSDDSDPFASFNFDDDDSPSSAPSPMQSSDDMDLDAQLEMLLMADKSADAGFEVRDLSVSPATQVYDPEVDGLGAVRYVKGSFSLENEGGEKLFANMAGWKIAATFFVGVFIIVVGAATAIVASGMVNAQNEQIAAFDRFTPIEIPADTANNARNIFLNERTHLNEETQFTLTRMVAAYSGTFFYFDEHFNPDDYYILLYNQARHLYSRTSFDIAASEGSGTVLRFGQLTAGTLFLTLHIQCRDTHDYAQFNYRFTSPPIHEGPAFVNHPIYAMGEGGLQIRHAVFDSGSSTIHFSYTPGSEAGVRLNMPEDEPFVRLFERFSVNAITPLTNENAVVYFEEFDLLMGSVTFGPILNIESDVEVHFSGLSYFMSEPVVKIAPSQLFGNDQWNPIPVPVGDFTLNFEGMMQQGSRVYMTMHALNEGGRRVPMNLDISLNVRTDGESISMPGRTNVYVRGTDVIFNMQPYLMRLRDVHISEYYFVVNSLDFELPSVVVPVNVTRFNNMPRLRRYEAERAVTETFLSLLEYKSGELSRENLVGVSNDSELLSFFAPARFEGRAMYAVNIATGDLEVVSVYDSEASETDHKFYYLAVVEVLWTAGEGADLQYFRESFRIVAQSTDLIWQIVEAERLE
ncbi:MAG: hypothetical protein FWC70_00085 [Defluviitaleaceae bacterium]|nr:hypothetical protein [Defluviitaleaceae bacterium]